MTNLSEEKSARLGVQHRGLSPAHEVPPSLLPRTSLVDKFALFGLSILILYATVRNIYSALMRPFWYDEICTILMVQQLRLHRLWQALAHGADGQSLPFYLLEGVAAALIRNENLAYRGISILTFAVTLICLFVAVKTRKGEGTALVATAVPLTTLLFSLFAVEARGYSILVACIAFAIVCYQRVPARRWVILLGLSLMLAECFHYFAVFAFLPFFLAECAHLGMTLQFRRGVWIALLGGFVPLACFWPLLSALQKYYGPSTWAQPTMEFVLNSYSWYFLTTEPASGLYLAALAGLAVLFSMLATVRRTARGSRRPSVPANELILVLGFLSLPLAGFAIAALSHGNMLPRYLLPSLLGFPLALGFTLPKLSRWSFLLPAVSAVLLLCVIVPRERQFWSFYNGQFVSPAIFVEDLVSAGGHPDLPVVISDGLDFLLLQHYADEGWQKRFVVVLDPGQTLVDVGNDAGEKQLAILRQYTNLPIYDWQPFLAQHPTFLLYSSNGGLDRDWWPRLLKKRGFKMQNVSVRPKETHDYFHRVVLVTR